jgi:hypothetical protein
MRKTLWLAAALFAIGCNPSPNRIELALAPDLISSEIGTIGAAATVFVDKSTTPGWNVEFDVAYNDRNGMKRPIAAISSSSNSAGEAKASFTGLLFEGSGTVTAKVLNSQGSPVVDDQSNPVQASATFGVLDQTPPKVTITSPANGAHLAANTPFTITVHATDEIGISQIFTQTIAANGNGNGGNGGNGSRIASGAVDVTVNVNADTGNSPTNTITINAMAADLSGNLGVAPAITITVP